ncbi:PinR Site-specific recombinases, DNA invertase Pin homologs [Methylophilaceae bacterium]
MVTKKFVAYFRVSTHKQGQSGLGLEAQELAVSNHLKEGISELVATFTEIETGKGANALERRPQLRKALEICRKNKATLIIAKLDRLARNVHFVSGLLETGCDFIAADMPHANKVMIQMHAVMSEWERDQISTRTKVALQAAKARGVILGKAGINNLKNNLAERRLASNTFAENLGGLIEGFKLRGLTQRAMVSELNQVGISAPKGGVWSLNQLQRLLHQI